MPLAPLTPPSCPSLSLPQSLPYLGELQSARVGTDGSGFFPAWHLRLVVVTHIPTGRVWQFRWDNIEGVEGTSALLLHCCPPPPTCVGMGFTSPAVHIGPNSGLYSPSNLLCRSCFSWIDKRCNYSRWLQLDSVEVGCSAPAGAHICGLPAHLSMLGSRLAP